MEVRSLFGLNSAVRKKRETTDHGPTDRRTDRQTLIQSRLFATKKEKEEEDKEDGEDEEKEKEKEKEKRDEEVKEDREEQGYIQAGFTF